MRKTVKGNNNSVVELPKGVKALITTKKQEVSVLPNRIFFSASLKDVVANTKDGKDYHAKVDYTNIDMGSYVLGVGVFVVRKDKVDTPKEQPKTQKATM